MGEQSRPDTTSNSLDYGAAVGQRSPAGAPRQGSSPVAVSQSE